MSSQDSLRAILFDFDGVLADSEPAHLAMFQKVLTEEGITLSKETYYNDYLGMDDRGCFEAVYKDQSKELSQEKRTDLIKRKNYYLLEYVHKNSLLVPGAAELIERLSKEYYLAIVSGALKSEILSILAVADLQKHFKVIVAADDVAHGKPSPEGFQLAIRLLNRDFVPASEILLPHECLVIEDSPWGLEAGHKAGTFCVAVQTSYPKAKLQEADLIFTDLNGIEWNKVKTLFG